MADKVKTTIKKSTVILSTKTFIKNKNLTLTFSSEHHKSDIVGQLAFFLVTLSEKDTKNNKAIIFTIDQYDQALTSFNNISKYKLSATIQKQFLIEQSGFNILNSVPDYVK